MIMEKYPNSELRLITEKGTGEFSNSWHHMCQFTENNTCKKNKNKIWCSVEEGLQNVNINFMIHFVKVIVY